MDLAVAFETIAEHCGWEVREVEAILQAASKSPHSQIEWIRIARMCLYCVPFSGKAVLNFDKGLITDAHYETSGESLERMLVDSKEG